MKDSMNVYFHDAKGDATDYKIYHAMAVTRDELRKELKDELSPIDKELKLLKDRLAEIDKSMVQLPTKKDLRELVVDKTKAMRGELIVWILGTAIALAGILKFVPSPGG